MPRPIVLKQQAPHKKPLLSHRDIINQIDTASELVKKAQRGGNNAPELSIALNAFRKAKEKKFELPKEHVVNEPIRRSRTLIPPVAETPSRRSSKPILFERVEDTPSANQIKLDRLNDRVISVPGLEIDLIGLKDIAKNVRGQVSYSNVNDAGNNVNNKKASRGKAAALSALGIGGAGSAAALGIGLGVGLNKIGNTKNNVDNVINKQSTIGQKDSNEDDEDSNDGYIVDDISSQTNKYARGGRIDGIAKRGRTKGRII